MALGSGMCPEVSMAPYGSTGHPISMALGAARSRTLIWSKVADQTPVLHMALSDDRGPGLRLRPWLPLIDSRPSVAALAWTAPWPG